MIRPHWQMSAIRRHVIRATAALFAAGIIGGSLSEPAAAQDYPNRPITIVVPLAAGGPLDLVARTMAEKLSAQLKQPVLIENRLGAGGSIGAEAVSRAKPDGHTLLFVLSGTMVVTPQLFPKIGYDTERDFKPISVVCGSSQMLVVHPSLPVDSVEAFVTLARKSPIPYAHAGYGSGGHLAMEYFRMMAKFDGVQVAYRGNAPLVNDLVGGQVKVGFVASAGVMPHVKAGRLRGLATSATERSPLAPDVPTMKEAGYPDLKLNTFFLLMAPAKTPDAIVERLEKGVRAIANLPDVQERLRQVDIEPLGLSATESRALVKSEIALWADIIERGNLREQK